MVLLLLVCANTGTGRVNPNASASAITITTKPPVLSVFMIKVSPSPPLRKSGKDALFEAGLLTHGLNTDLLSSPSHPVGQWLFVADFVAVHSCEGSGGFAPLFPLTSNASWLSKPGMQKCSTPLQSSP